jgi:hypothetical protein
MAPPRGPMAASASASPSRGASRAASGGEVKLAGGATVEGMYLTGAAFSLVVAKRAPMIVVDASN